MLGDAVKFLICPVCGRDLLLADKSLHCASNHTFDVSRKGYVNLLPGNSHIISADTLEMVNARGAFLRSGRFEIIRSKVVEVAASLSGASKNCCVVDIGAGTGHYLAAILDRLPGCTGLALDLSKFAARRAAQAHNRIGAVVCDAWGSLPIRTASILLILDIFAPRNPLEFQRILKPEGALIVVIPTKRHLQELVPLLDLLNVDEHKRERLDKTLATHFSNISMIGIEETVLLSRNEVTALVSMGPSAWHTKKSTLSSRIHKLPEPISVTISVIISAYRST